jgi:hypothetical protein
VAPSVGLHAPVAGAFGAGIDAIRRGTPPVWW